MAAVVGIVGIAGTEAGWAVHRSSRQLGCAVRIGLGVVEVAALPRGYSELLMVFARTGCVDWVKSGLPMDYYHAVETS